MPDYDALPVFRQTNERPPPGLVVKPLLQQYLYNAKYPEALTIKLEKHALDHGPDGWFHPSTHPTMGARQLYYYLTQPGAWIPEDILFGNELSLTFGEATHGFIKACLFDMGVLVKPPQMTGEIELCPCGIKKCDEWYWIDESTNARGHSDGVLAAEVPSHPHLTRQMFEFKTKSPLAKGIKDLDLEHFKTKHPDYYGQQQEYLRMSGYQLSILVFMQMGYPWLMTEIHIPYDPAWSQEVVDKYIGVAQAAVTTQLPPPCCSVGSTRSKECPARAICPVAQEAQ